MIRQNILKILREATTKFEIKINDIALMTFDEYMKFNNEDGEMHDNSAYQTTYVDELNFEKEFNISKRFNKVIQRIKRNGLNFTLRSESEELSYSKYNEEKGEHIRDENGKIISYTKQEIIDANLPTHSYSFGIFDESDVKVASAQDEWGATLIYVVDEYKGFGFAKDLKDVWVKQYPDKRSGGLTRDGYNFTKKYYYKVVREYLAKGFYSHLIRTNQISKEKVNKIIKDLPKRSKKPDKINLKFDDVSDLLLLQPHKGLPEFIIYNKAAFEYYQSEKEEKYYHWIDNIIKGYISFLWLDQDESYIIFNTYFEEEKYEKIIKNIVLSWSENTNQKFYLNSDTLNFVGKENINVVTKSNFYNKGTDIGVSTVNNIDYTSLAKREKIFRKTKDKYDEYLNRIWEHAFGLGE